MFYGTTDFSIFSETSEKTIVRLPKYVADIMQGHVIDLHQWIEVEFIRISDEGPNLSRRAKGDLIRQKAMFFIQETAEFKNLLVYGL